MLGSTSCSQQQSQELIHLQSDPPVAGELQHHQLLLTCARYISQTNFTAAHRIATILSANSSPSGDSSERLIHSFTKALSLRLHPPSPNNNNIITENDDAILHASYLSLNQVTPFIRFSHLTANQAILEAIDQSHHNNIHILDFDIMHGFQWPPLMQAIADRHPPPTLRITATGTNINHLRITGDRLAKFAHSLGLTFRFFPLLLPHTNNNNDNMNDEAETVNAIINRLSAVLILPNETLAVNCVLYLHRFLVNRDKLCLLLRKIKSMNPKVVTLAENEANHNNSIFISRFNEALNYYTAVFDSLEATLPPNSRERAEVEQVWFGREIADIVAAEGEHRRARHERFLSWEMMMRIAGFQNVRLSPFALTQAKLLLRLHYPSQGYNLEVVNDCFFLGWQNQPLFSVSSWH
ncbi:scarecrow-like protein 18 [Bidens hawaiensis]|uniref:scarecrow-like protein 18 n=1 Tax=Bidens hawaiensis TaxID=980011 RepID=UPI00404AB845